MTLGTVEQKLSPTLTSEITELETWSKEALQSWKRQRPCHAGSLVLQNHDSTIQLLNTM